VLLQALLAGMQSSITPLYSLLCVCVIAMCALYFIDVVSWIFDQLSKDNYEREEDKTCSTDVGKLCFF